MNQTEYFRAAVPEPWTILGLRLRPFSAGHLILLHRVESAFVCGGDVTWDDLALSVLICSQTFEDSIKTFSDPDLPQFMVRWYRKLSGGGWFKKPVLLNIEEKASDFSSYLKEGCQTPDYIYNEGGSSVGDVPTVQVIKAFLMSKTSMSESEFLNRPWALSMWDFLTIQSVEGHVQLCSQETVSDAQGVGARLAQLIKEGKIKCRS